MAVYPAKYVGLNAFERANAMAGLPIGFQDISAKPINVTLGGTGFGTGQTTIEGARDYLANIPSGITGQGPRFTAEEINQALSGITGAFQTGAEADAALRARMTAFTPEELYAEEIGSYRGMLDQPRNGVDVAPVAQDNPLQALMDMLAGVTGTQPSQVVGSGGSFNINAPAASTIKSGQTSFTMDANGLRVIVPGKSAIRIPINSAGIYRDAITAALRNAGVPEADIQIVLADYAMTRQGQGESAPTAEAQNVTDAFAGLFGGDTTTGDTTSGTQDTQLDQFLQLFGLGGTTAAAAADDTTAAGDTTAATGGDVWSNLFGAMGGGDAGDGMPSQFGGMLDFLNLGEQQDGLQDTFLEPGMGDLERGVAGFLDAIAGRETANADIIDTALGNLFGDTTTTQSSDLLKELFGEEFTFEGIADAFAQDPQMAMIMAGQLGQQNLDLFTTLITEAQNTRRFDQAMREFTEGIKVEKQGQQITVLNKMMDITLGQMQLGQTAENNLMNAQIAAMNTALKSKELSQAEQASIRSNLLDAVGLELQEKRINNEQANFLSNQILAQTELALRVRELDQRGESAAADRELEREGMALTERLGLADITAGILGRQAELQFSREGLAQERELGFAGIDQRREEAAMSAQVALLNAAMQNPYSFAALSSLGGIPGMAGGAAPAAAAVSPTGMFPSLAGLGFQIPETARAGTTTPAPAFFSGGMPTVGALGELDPASLAFLQNVLAFSGTPPEGLGRMAGAVTPAAGGYPGLGRTFFG
jgi:hypothetical protein